MNNTPTGLIAAKRLAVAVAAVCATLAAPAFADDDVKVLLDLMLKKGVITQQDYDQFMKDNADKAENKEFKTQRLDKDVNKSVTFMQKRATDGAVSESGFGLVSNNGDHTINLTGRVHFDSRVINTDLNKIKDRDTASVGDNFELRRARIGINGRVFKDINYEIVANAVGSSTNTIDTAWMNYGFNKDAQVRVGRFKQPFSLEELTSSNNIDFMERSYVNQLIPGKQLGAMIHGEPQKGFTYGASLYQQGFDPSTNESNLGSMAAARLTANFAELNNISGQVIHLGFAATGGKYQVVPTTSGNTQATASTDTRATIMAFRSENRGLANSYRSQIGGDRVTTGSYNASANNAASVTQLMGGLEFALANGPYKFQSEYAITNRDATHPGVSYASSESATTQTNPRLNARAKTMYAEVMYNVTGESWADAYRTGAFSAVRPKSNFVYGTGGGAWQVGVRYSSYDASDTAVGNGGWTPGSQLSRVQNSAKANTVTLAANWILNPNARVMFNVSQTRFDTPVEALDTRQDSSTTKNETVVSVRTQINF